MINRATKQHQTKMVNKESPGKQFFCQDQITATSFDKPLVHNHLNDTQIFTTIGSNGSLCTTPSEIHFKGFEAGKRHQQKLRILNITAECQRIHVLPPSSQYLTIKYKKQECLVPGMYLEVSIYFTPVDNQYLCDCIKIHCQESSNLVVPIHAYMHLDVASCFPTKMLFKPTVVGKSEVKTVPLKNDTSADFEFTAALLKKNPLFKVIPTEGVIRAHSSSPISITFSPKEFLTSTATLEITVSQFDGHPFHCSLYGSSKPGLQSSFVAKELKRTDMIVDPRSLSPLGRFRLKKSGKKNVEEKAIIKDGVAFSVVLNSVAAVRNFLTQNTGKMKAKTLKEAVRTKSETPIASKEVKEALFENDVQKNISDEQRNQLRWCVRLGEDPETADNEADISNDTQPVNTVIEEQYRRIDTVKVNQRTLRPANTIPECQPLFHFVKKESLKDIILQPFIQIARKIILRNRMSRHIRSLKNHLESCKEGNFMSSHQRTHKDFNKEQAIVNEVSTDVDTSRIKYFTFPRFTDPSAKDHMAVDDLGPVETRPIHVTLISNTEVHNLKVPLQYKLLSYKPDLDSAYNHRHVPKGLARKLRSGTEVTSVTVKDEKETSTPLPFVLPEYLLDETSYPQLHIFNPLPGAQVHTQPIPYTEVDDDFYMSPIPLISPTTRQDMIPGLSKWRAFPSQGIMASNNATLCQIYYPTWNEPFANELLPSAVPVIEPLVQMEKCDDVIEEIPTVHLNEFVTSEDLKFATQNVFQPSFYSACDLQSSSSNNERENLISCLNVHLKSKENELGKRISKSTEMFRKMWN